MTLVPVKQHTETGSQKRPVQLQATRCNKNQKKTEQTKPSEFERNVATTTSIQDYISTLELPFCQNVFAFGVYSHKSYSCSKYN